MFSGEECAAQQTKDNSHGAGQSSAGVGGERGRSNLLDDLELMREIGQVIRKLRKLEHTLSCQQQVVSDVEEFSRFPLRIPPFKSTVNPEIESFVIGLIDLRTTEVSSDCGVAKMSQGAVTSSSSVEVNSNPKPTDNGQQQAASQSEPIGAGTTEPPTSETRPGEEQENRNNDRHHDNNNSMNCDSRHSINQINDEDIKALVKELKRKIEYTERMNWLCLSKRPLGPPHRKTSLPKHCDVKKRFIEICDTVFSDEVKAALRLPAFDSYEWEDAEVIHLMQHMFTELDLLTQFNIPVALLREWLYEVYKHYNDVPFHNFRHCFCVAQMMYAIVWKTDLINRLGHLEVLILLISCICHDLDHPGYNNIYQINARTELALRYNDISPLENHHCSIAFRLFEHPETNIFQNLSKETFKEIREGIIRCILATDMARHNEILTHFKDITPTFDYSNKAHTNLLCMVLIKVADISNEARPLDVAEPWLDRLLQEFFAQSAAEKKEGLPVTPFMDPDKVSRSGSQVRFIGLVLLPLFEALAEILTELNDFIVNPVRFALDYYRKMNDSQTRSRRSLAEAECSSESGGSPQMPRSQSGISVRSKKSIPSQKSASRTSVDEPMCINAELHDLPEGSESGDSETATEVDVAEKTSKFKVDTESSGRSKSSQPPSRKTSKEKRPSMCVEMYNSSRMRASYGNIHANHHHRNHFGANRAVSLDQCQNSRRMSSDGIQSVTSDSSVFYNLNSHNNQINNHQHNNHPILHQHIHNCNIHSVLAKQQNSSNNNSTTEDSMEVDNGSSKGQFETNNNNSSSEASSKNKKKNSLKKRDFRFRSLKSTSLASPSPSQPPAGATAPPSSCSSTSAPNHPNSDSRNNNTDSNQFAANPASTAANPGVISSSQSSSSSHSRSIFARLRQFTGRFNFTFDNSCTSGGAEGSNKAAEQKRLSGVNTAPTGTSATMGTSTVSNNNNAGNGGGGGSTTSAGAANNNNVNLFNQTASSTKNLNHKKLLSEFGMKKSPNMKVRNDSVEAVVLCRSRAYSLDVPAKNRYSSGSSSRKSSASKNDDSSESSAFVLAATNNNNNNVTCSCCGSGGAWVSSAAEGNCEQDKLSTSSIKLKGGSLLVNNLGVGVEEEVRHFIDDNVANCCDEPCDLGTASQEPGEGCNLLNNSIATKQGIAMNSSSSNLSKNVNI